MQVVYVVVFNVFCCFGTVQYFEWKTCDFQIKVITIVL